MRAPPPPPVWANSMVSVGITGTNGKTSTTGMVAALLGILGRPVARSTTLGCFLDEQRLEVDAHYAGFLQTMERCRAAGGRYAALEMTSEALALGFARAWPCRVGVFTNLTLDHSDAHGSAEHYLASKAQLFVSLPAGGFAVLNGCDDNAELLLDVLAPGVDVIRYGVGSRGPAWGPLDLAVRDIELSWQGTRATLLESARFSLGQSPAGPQKAEVLLRLQTIGEIFVEDALAALGCGLALGVPLEQALQALARVPAPPGRFEVVRQNPHVVVDYAHTPDALERTLSTARKLCRGALHVVFGAGGDRDRAKRPLLGVAAGAADHIMLTSDNPRSEAPEAIIEAIAAGVGAHASVRREVDRARAIQLVLAAAAPDDVIVIAGKGHEQTQALADQSVRFSDVAVVNECDKSAR